MTLQIGICIVIFIIALYMFASRVFPMGIASAITLMLFFVTGCIKPEDAIALFGNKNVVILVGMSVIGAAFLRTQFVNKCVDFLVKISAGKFKVAYIGFILVAAFLSNCGIDPTVLFLILSPLMLKLCDRFGVSRTKALLPWLIGYVGAMGSMPLSGLVNQAAMQNGFMESYGFTETMDHIMIFKARMPATIVSLAYAAFIAPKLAPEKPINEIKELESRQNEQAPLPKFQEICAIVIFFGTIVALLLAKTLGLEPYQIAIAAGVLVPLTRVLNEQETIKAIPIGLIFLFCGSMSIGIAMQTTGAGDLIGQGLAKLLGGTHNSYIIGLAVFIPPFILTQFMMNQTTMQCFIPIILLTCKAIGANPVGPMMLLFCASCTAYLTPMAMAACSACADVGGYDMKSMIKTGWPLALAAIFISVFWTMHLYPCF